MLVTPEAARTKRCPMRIAAGSITAIDGGNCVGAQCMAWRWKASLNRWVEGTRQREEVSKTHGVCGLAGGTL